MPSDRPPPEPKRSGSDPAGRRRPTSAVRDGTLVFALVLGAFVAYALGATTTFQASAVVAVSTTPGSSPSLPSAAEATDRLRRAALDPALVASLAKEERPLPPSTVAEVGSRIAKSISVESFDGRNFTFSATASSPERAQRIVNELAQQAAKRAAQLLDPQPPPAVDASAKAKAELLDFLNAHPGIASEPSAEQPRSGPDPLVRALRVEKSRIEAKLAQPWTPSAENPYEEPPPLENPEFLKRRLKEIDNALEARTKPARPSANADGSSRTSAADLAEWQRLLRAASETKSPEPTPAPVTRLRVTLARAALPHVPIDPNRPRVVLLGVLLASLAGVVAAVLRSVLEARAIRRYGMVTGQHPAMPLTTLRIPREQLPKPIAPQVEPPPTPVPPAPSRPPPMMDIPRASRVPAPTTPLPPAPIVPSPVTPIPPAPIVPSPITPIPPAPIAPSPITSIPPAPLVPNLQVEGASAPPLANAPVTPNPPARIGAALATPAPPAPNFAVPTTPIPPTGVAPPHVQQNPPPPMVIQAPTADDDGAPPTTQSYGAPEKPKKARNAGRRITKIYGTPPPPELEEEAKVLRTTQAYGSPPVAIPSNRPPEIPHTTTPFPAEVLPPVHRNSMRPAPMIPLTSSSAPPPVAPSNRAAPLAETGYSYVQTPVPAAPDSIPQTPHPRRPSPPPRTQPYGSVPPAQSRGSHGPATTPKTPVPSAATPKTPLPPEPAPKAPVVVVRTHPVASSWRPNPALAPERKKPLAAEVLTLAVDGCLVIGVTGVRGVADKKSIAAAEVALALADAKHPRVLLMESDFHFPQVQKWLQLDVPFAAGFSQQIRARIDTHREGRWHVMECKPSLHVLAEGVMRAPGLLLSNQFEQAMQELRSYYDIILIDAPVALNESDGQAIADVVDGAIVVGPASRTGEIMEISKIFSGRKLLRAIES